MGFFSLFLLGFAFSGNYVGGWAGEEPHLGSMGKIALSGFLLLLCVVCGFLAQLGSDDAPQVPLWGGGKHRFGSPALPNTCFRGKTLLSWMEHSQLWGLPDAPSVSP